MTKKYEVVKLTNKNYLTKAGTSVNVQPLTSTAIILKNGENIKLICYIPDVYHNVDGIAEGIAHCLNKNISSVILPLKI